MRSLGRLHSARTLAATLLAVLLLAGCGDDPGEGDTTGDSEENSSSSDSPEGSGTVEVSPQPETVAILSATAAGGSTENPVVRLDRPGGLEELTGSLGRRGQQLGQELRQVVNETEVPEGMALVGGVVAIGCDVPSDVKVAPGDDGRAMLAPDWTGVTRLQECFAPVTSVAVVLVGEELA